MSGGDEYWGGLSDGVTSLVIREGEGMMSLKGEGVISPMVIPASAICWTYL